MKKTTQCTDLDKFLEDYKIQRLKQLSKELRTSKEYQRLGVLESTLYAQLREGMPDELKSVLCKYNDMFNEMFKLYESFFYNQGYNDCGQFLGLLCKGSNNPPPCSYHLSDPSNMFLNTSGNHNQPINSDRFKVV